MGSGTTFELLLAGQGLSVERRRDTAPSNEGNTTVSSRFGNAFSMAVISSFFTVLFVTGIDKIIQLKGLRMIAHTNFTMKTPGYVAKETACGVEQLLSQLEPESVLHCVACIHMYMYIHMGALTLCGH